MTLKPCNMWLFQIHNLLLFCKNCRYCGTVKLLIFYIYPSIFSQNMLILSDPQKKIPQRKCLSQKSYYDTKRGNSFQDANKIYLQPCRRRSMAVHRPNFQRLSANIDSDTIYSTSYRKVQPAPNKIKPKDCKSLSELTGRMDLETSNGLSYIKRCGERPKCVYPKDHFGSTGWPMVFETIYAGSYSNPGIIRTTLMKPPSSKKLDHVPMENTTITKESYLPPEVTCGVKISKPSKEVWRTDFKPDYHSVTRLSYQGQRYLRCRSYKPTYQTSITEKMDCKTIQRNSYIVPDCSVNKF